MQVLDCAVTHTELAKEVTGSHPQNLLGNVMDITKAVKKLEEMFTQGAQQASVVICSDLLCPDCDPVSPPDLCSYAVCNGELHFTLLSD
jgi:hypothetical protein